MKQKVKKVPLEKLMSVYSHPSASLYRSIELKQIYRGCNGISFKKPSLDIGSGDGLISSLLFDKKFTYGVDNGEANDYLVSIKKHRYKKVFLESAEKMSIPSKSINFVFSNSVLEHIPNINGVFSETSRVLKRGGYFVFTTPSKHFKKAIVLSQFFNKVGLNWINNVYSNFRNKALNHYNLHDHVYYSKLFKRYHFKIVYHSYSINKSTLRLWDKMALAIKIASLFGIDLSDIIKAKYQKEIKYHYTRPNINKKRGMNLLVIAKRV